MCLMSDIISQWFICHYLFWRNFDIYDKLCDVLQNEMIVLLSVVVPFKPNEVVWILLYNVWDGRRSWEVIGGLGEEGAVFTALD